MRVKVIFLDYKRKDFSDRVKEQNFNNAGHPFDYIVIEREGISAAINTGIQASRNYDAVVTMANDILMPDNWLKAMVEHAQAIPHTGMAGIHCVEGVGTPTEINGKLVNVSPTAFGNVLIPMQAINTIGFFNVDFDPYGMQDADYAYRLNCSGFVNYYIPNYQSQHIGHDVGQNTDYRKMKDEGLSKCPEKWLKWTKHYVETGNYTIDYPDYANI